MIRHPARGLKTRNERQRQVAGRRRWNLTWSVEALEGRVVLSGNPTVYTVDLVSDTGAGTGTTGDLAFTINQANNNPNPAGSLIQFDPSVFTGSSPQPIVLTKTLDLTGTAGPIVINEPGAQGVEVTGNNAVTVFAISAGVTASFSELGIVAGRSPGDGGGVLNDGALTLSDCTVANSAAVGWGGGIENNGTLTVTDSYIAGDKAEAATGYGGGIGNFGTLQVVGSYIANNQVSGANGVGGGLYNAGTLMIVSSQVEDNSVTDGDGGGIANNGTATISLSTIASNSNTGFGTGGGIFNLDNLTLADSAVISNSAGSGGGILNESILSMSDSTIAENTASIRGGGIENTSTMQAVNVTIATNIVNTAGGGGRLFALAATTNTLVNTIVAQNNQIVGLFILPDDIVGTVSPSSTFNLIGTGGGGGLTNGFDGNQVGVSSPGLGSLANNGGSSETIALLPGSPAINAGANIPNSGTTDQRGPGFARILNGGVDIGAYELQPGIVTGVTVEWGSFGDATLQTAADGLRLLPAGRKTDLPWLGINDLGIELNQPETLTAANITISSQRGTQYGPFTVTEILPGGVGVPFLYAIAFAHPINKADRITITIAGPGIVSYTRRLDVLPGDFNDNGVVNNKDITAIRNEWKGKNGAHPTIFGDIQGDGTVSAADYNAARKRNGSKLPKLPRTGGKPPMAVLVHALARQHHDVRPRHQAESGTRG